MLSLEQDEISNGSDAVTVHTVVFRDAHWLR